ncbi:hypothetical protein SARC_09601 [Sphaeroforma arctica JP610]|uniref:CBS domain-containing protein n=1 Tax=Sphaeroforma arctica JP610 TaxID=667725 RepID=A0A0L0FN84_9EUKA|nr:hypothetical protein SARC_09601 [Sphaeroforma arctica JP610]KNC77951.1 hypothetical protein SARC_09601 [Sphaeroforma arctica JP610]|eukprot:XP_014151853.1 hypothetical protein SARC_09601 [Sphaeroforma arctica JP610]
MVDAGQVLASAGQMKSGDTLYTIGEDDSILKALVMMKEKNAGALLVTHADVVSGIITERDYLTKVVVKGLCSRTSPVSAVMTKKVVRV